MDPEDGLSVRVGAAEPVDAAPRIRDVFWLRAAAELRFSRDGERRVDGFTLNAHGVRGVRFARRS